MLEMNIKLGQSTNPITNMFQAELHVCKQQLIKMCFPCFSQYLKHPNRYVYETSQTPRLC